jgi:hypothetical protein
MEEVVGVRERDRARETDASGEKRPTEVKKYKKQNQTQTSVTDTPKKTARAVSGYWILLVIW